VLVIAAWSSIERLHSTESELLKATTWVSPATTISGTPSPVRSATVGAPPQNVARSSALKGTITRLDAKTEPSWFKIIAWFDET
jgi:hypothetical protein